MNSSEQKLDESKAGSELGAGRELDALVCGKAEGDWAHIIKNKRSLRELDKLSLALANESHRWSADERTAFDSRVQELKRKEKRKKE